MEAKASMAATVNMMFAMNLNPAILGIPYALSKLGIFFGTLVMVLMTVASHQSMLLYVKTRDLLPMKLNDSWEVAYVLFGRKSIFVVCGVLFVFAWILCVISYISAAETLCSIIYGALKNSKKGYED